MRGLLYTGLFIGLAFLAITGCGDDPTSTPTGPGTIIVDSAPDHLRISWTLTNNHGLTHNGLNDETIKNMAAGRYTLAWWDIPGWVTPDTQSGTLENGRTLTFRGTYTEIPVETGTIEIAALPESIAYYWIVTGPRGIETTGVNDTVLENMEVGSYTITWGSLDDWATPPNETLILEKAATITFHGTYLPSGTIVIDPTPADINAPWLLWGPENVSGYGAATLEEMEVGLYALVWNDVSVWVAPPQETLDLAMAETVTFSGSYQEDPGLDGELLLMPPGTFWMGSPEDEVGRNPVSETRHQVTLTRPYYLGKYEVTEELWDAVMGSGTSTSQLPVGLVSYIDAIRFCNAYSLKEGFTPAYDGVPYNWTWNQDADGYRLPTEAEWEHACRAGSTTAFANGPITEPICELDPYLDLMGWYCGNSPDSAQPVGLKQANAWGLFDMHGNQVEWCWDWWMRHQPGAVTDPLGPDSGEYKVLKSGSWVWYAAGCRSAARGWDIQGGSGYPYGLRLARSVR
ncbi:MAG: formylglycine-generating enzyme family protein [Candidatus Krumholzibacteriota bacterium]